MAFEQDAKEDALLSLSYGEAPALAVAPPVAEAASPAGPDEPVIGPLLRLALPTIAVLIVQTLVSVAETYFVGHLGTNALAGVALVFPVLMLMTMMSNGGFGSGASAAIARAMGAGRKQDADALVLHAVVVALALGAVFSIGVIGGGHYLFEALGGKGEALEAAKQYSFFIFAGAVLIWLVNMLSSALRGAGDVKTPAWVIVAGAFIVVPASPAFIFGFGPVPAFGVAGAGIAILIYYVLASVALVLYVRSKRSSVRLIWCPLEWRLFSDILGVGGLSAIGSMQSNLTIAIVTSLVSVYGSDAIAGYGIASRLDYVLIPIMFGLGMATLILVGRNVGANRIPQARKIAWTSAAIGFFITETAGILAALFPGEWLRIFSDDPNVLATGTTYLRIVGPCYGFFGAGMMLFFSTQGAKRVLFSTLSGTARFLIASAGGFIAIRFFHAGLSGLFAMVAAATCAFGTLIALSVWLRPWKGGAALGD